MKVIDTVWFCEGKLNRSVVKGYSKPSNLEPTDAIENTPQLPKSAELKTPKPTLKKMAKLRTSKPRHIHPTYAQLPADREFVPPRRGGLFGLFLSRRF
jgi:hypothetical protein